MMTRRKSPHVSIIILNYNCKGFLNACISSVLNTNYSNYEIIFVDNNSSDGSTEFVLQNFGSLVKVVKLARNYGFSAGNNIGAEHAMGDYLVFLNPDVIVDSDWLKNSIGTLENDSSIGIAQPKLLLMNKTHFDSAGGFINPFGFVKVRGVGEKDVGQYDVIKNVFYAKGAALFIRHDVWNRLGGFDPIFFIYFEDTDLCWRSWRLGYRVVYLPFAKIYHAGGGILNKVPYHLKLHEARGRLILLLKNHSLRNVFLYVPITLLFYSINLIRQLVKRNELASVAIFKGTLWWVFNFKKIWALRGKTKTPLRDEIKKEFDKNISKLFQNSNMPFIPRILG